ncbi:hypothetical protein QQ054_00790 [Oscillatoria amoena NRMC-F 0135]|nr:hypothetical protein [Oscillatoria amoena NRMC-F 0135]
MEKEVKRLQLFLQSYLDAEHGNQANYVPTFYKSKMQKIANNRQYYFSIEYINELGDGEEFHVDADIYGYLCFIIALLEDLERREKLALGVIANDNNYTQIEPDENGTWPSKKIRSNNNN